MTVTIGFNSLWDLECAFQDEMMGLVFQSDMSAKQPSVSLIGHQLFNYIGQIKLHQFQKRMILTVIKAALAYL